MKHYFKAAEKEYTRLFLIHFGNTVNLDKVTKKIVLKLGKKFTSNAAFVDLEVRDTSYLISVLDTGISFGHRSLNIVASIPWYKRWWTCIRTLSPFKYIHIISRVKFGINMLTTIKEKVEKENNATRRVN